MIRILTFLAFTLTTVAVAEVPSLINYQGRLTGPGGAPANGSKNFALKIYDAATDGTLLYSEDVGAITLGEGGVYSFRFGATGTSNTLITETVGTGSSENLYQKVLSNTPVVAGSVSVSDGTYTWSQSAGSSNEDDFNASFSTNLNRITVNYFAGAPNDGRQIEVTYRYGAAGIVGALSSGSGHWLQLTIDGEVQATRERVLAVPFALVAGKLAGKSNAVKTMEMRGTKFLPGTINEIERIRFIGSLAKRAFDEDGITSYGIKFQIRRFSSGFNALWIKRWGQIDDLTGELVYESPTVINDLENGKVEDRGHQIVHEFNQVVPNNLKFDYENFVYYILILTNRNTNTDFRDPSGFLPSDFDYIYIIYYK
jgi:hypothetical protein